jgi:hypothetical protein
MAVLYVDQVDPQSGTTLTIGTSGDTFTLGSGVVQSNLNYPAFEAYLSANQSITDDTDTKIQYDTEVLDTDNCYDNSTNYRFTPTKAGKYFVYVQNSLFALTHSTLNIVYNNIFKNGSVYKYSSFSFSNNYGRRASPIATAIIDMNGTTDYLEVFVHIDVTSGTPRAETNTKGTYFGAYRIGT